MLPREMRGEPDPLPLVPVVSSMLKPGDGIEWYDELRPGDIVVLFMIHQNNFGVKRVTAAEAAKLPGPKYVVPSEYGGGFGPWGTMAGWEEYRAPERPWWKFW
jgi:hypothetical protein